MSVMILDGEHFNLLASALVRCAGFPTDAGQDLARVFLRENVDAFLRRYYDGAEVLEDSSEVDEDDLEEIDAIRSMLRDHRFVAAQDAELTPDVVRSAIGRWRYQVSSQDGHEDLAGWLLCDQLEAALPR